MKVITSGKKTPGKLNMLKFTVKDLILNSIVGAIYFILVFAFQFMSFGDLFNLIAEVLLILVLFNSKFSVGIILGTFLSNLLNFIW